MKPIRIACSALVGAGLGAAGAAAREDIQELDLGAIAQRQPGVAGLVPATNGVPASLRFAPARENQALELWSEGTPLEWGTAAYLVCEVWHTNATSAILNLDFHRIGDPATDSPRISPKIGVLPGLPTQVIFPLSYLDGQEIFLPRFPRQLKGTVLGSRLPRDEIGALRLRLSPVEKPGYPSTLILRRVFLSNEPPPPLPRLTTPYVDEFGQWAGKEWPGKIRDADQLGARLRALDEGLGDAALPSGWSRFGGWKEKRFEATGFFRTHHDGRRWWLADPEGYAFVSAGMDCVRPSSSTVVQGQDDLFAWVPDDSGNFADAVGGRGVDYLKANLIRVYGDAWQTNWSRLTAKLLRQAGFNTVANWSDTDFAREAKLPYVLPMRDFPSTSVLLYRDFPDVFAEEYAENARQFARQLEAFKDDPYLIGYFLSNEPHWAFGRNNLAFEMFATPVTSSTKQAFVQWVAARYQDDLARFNAAWRLTLEHIEDLAGQRFLDPPSPSAEEDFWAFSKLMAARYVDVPCDAVTAIDPHHLNLGMRYAWISSDLLYAAGQRFDVYSINGYSFPAPPDTAEIARRSGKPVMIGEFHFGATDRGLPATGIQGVASQADRAAAYRYYAEQGFARPEVIGLHYFQWNDQPISGRFDGENYNIGFLDICHQPYRELMEAARRTHQRLYPVASGAEAPVVETAVRGPAVFF